MDSASIEILFWGALGVLVYTWLGYPALLFVCERLMYAPVRKRDIQPRVSVLVVAHDEEAVIARKIENLLALDYPRERLEIVIASDGSHDNTTTIVQRYAEHGVKLRAFPLRRGKPSVLNDVVPDLEGEIVVLVDARQRLEQDLLRKLLSNFGDPTVGGVSGELVFEQPERVGIAVSMDIYWRYEKWIREKEAGIHSTVGGTGAVFALRKELFRSLPGETILDDVVLPFHIVKRGYRVVMEMGARAWDVAHTDWQREFARKARTLSGNFQILFNLRRMGAGVLGPISFQYYSHKVLRLLGPFCLLVLLAANWKLVSELPPTQSGHSLYLACLVGQLLFHGAAVAGFLLRGALLKIPWIALPNSFVLMQIAVFVGFLRYGSGRDDALWDKVHALDPASLQQRLWRLFFDSFLFTAGFVLAYYIRYLGAPPSAAFASYMELFPALTLTVPQVDLGGLLLGPFGIHLALPTVMLIPAAVFYFFRINETRTEEVSPEHMLTLIKGIFYSTLFLFFVIYMRRAAMLIQVPHADGARVISMPTSVLILGFGLDCLMIGGWRLCLRALRRAAEGGLREGRDLMLVSDTPVTPAAARMIETAYDPPARLIPVRPDADEPTRGTAPAELRETLGMIRPDGLLLGTASLSREEILQGVALADERQLPASLLPGELELILAQTPPRLTRYIPTLDLGRQPGEELSRIVKRAIDLAAGLLGLLGVPFLTALLIASRQTTSGAKRIRIQGVCRIGRRGQAFVSPRLRFTKGWPRTWVWLARTSLFAAELLAGYRSLVGPRALLPRHYAGLAPCVRRFLSCRPGLIPLGTVCVWQAKRLDRRSASILYYARYHSLVLDLMILLNAWPRRVRPSREPTP